MGNLPKSEARLLMSETGRNFYSPADSIAGIAPSCSAVDQEKLESFPTSTAG
jgi:hypothetical protein